MFFASGRTDLSNNHMEQQHGCVLTAAEVAVLEDPVIIIHSEGFALIEFN